MCSQLARLVQRCNITCSRQLPDPDQSTANGTIVTNRPAENATRWFWFLESPEKAHTNYEKNKRVIRAMVPKPNERQTTAATGTKATSSSALPN